MSGGFDWEMWQAAGRDVAAHLAADRSFVRENPLTISEIGGDRVVVRLVTHSTETMRVFINASDVLFEVTRRVVPDEERILHNGVQAMPLGWAKVLPLETAIDWVRSVRQLSTNPLPCHFCDVGDGRYGLARVDHCKAAYIAQTCEACHEAVFGGDDDD